MTSLVESGLRNCPSGAAGILRKEKQAGVKRS
jgi:hypothetical protein